MNNDERRKILKTLGAGALSLSLGGLVACSDSDNTDNTNNEDDEDDTGDTNTGDTNTGDTNTGEWASGKTDLITEDFPDDSIFDDSSASCTLSLTNPTTEGPCYFSVDNTADISSGLEGLPMQLCLRLIDSDCNPVEGYGIEVWHCDTDGIYSGDTSDSDNSSSFAGNFCTGGDSEAEKSTWYRGGLTTDSSGRVNLKSCFPGWYSGRTLHIHFSVTSDTDSYVISQFCFPDSFAKEICTTHELYKSRGEQDTTLAGGRDTVFGSDYELFYLKTEQNDDGTLLAYATIQIT